MRARTWILAAALAVGTVPLAIPTVHADEKNEHEKVIKLDDVPKPARDALVREAAGAPIVRVEQENEHGKVLYEAVVKKGDDLLGITVDPSGKLIDKHSEKHEHEKK